MADPVWLNSNNVTTVHLKTSTGSLETFDRLEAFDSLGQTFLVTLYSLTTFLAFTGNTVVILVELYGKRSARNLQKFLINLAISDLLIGVLSTPFIYTDIMLGRWIFHPLLCPLAQFVQIMSVLVSTYTLTFIGIERYFATLHPLSSANTWLRSHCNLVLWIGWVLGLILASLSVQNTRIEKFTYHNVTYNDCKHWIGTERDMQIYVASSFVLTFVLPMTFLTISYGAIGRRLLRAQKHWCSFKQTAPFSLHSMSRTQSNSLNSNSSNQPANSQQMSDGQSRIKSVFIRCKPTRQSIKIKASHSRSDNSHSNSNQGPIRTNTVKMITEQVNGSTSKVFIRFDKRNTDFLNKMRVFRLLVAVLVLFIICWLPIKIFMLVIAFYPSIVYLDSSFKYYTYYITYFLCHWLSMSNSFANPILYCFMSKSFRADLIDLFVCICSKLSKSYDISQRYSPANNYHLQQQQIIRDQRNRSIRRHRKMLDDYMENVKQANEAETPANQYRSETETVPITHNTRKISPNASIKKNRFAKMKNPNQTIVIHNQSSNPFSINKMGSL